MITFSYSLVEQLWGLLLILIGWFIKLSVQTFKPIILIYKMGNSVSIYRSLITSFFTHIFYQLGTKIEISQCRLVYRPLSYPYISLIMHQIKEKQSSSLFSAIEKYAQQCMDLKG